MKTVDELIEGIQRPLVIAHRGASHYYRENTLEAFRGALDMKAEMLEMDVRRTTDGVLVVHHDPDIAGKEIGSLSKAQLEERAQREGYSIPTLTQALEACAGRIPVDVELKEAGCEEQVLEEALGLLEPEQLLISSVQDTVIRKVKDLRPDIRTGYILSSHPRWQLLNKLYPGTRARRAGADVLVVSQKLLKLGVLSTTRDLGLPVWVYTLNDRGELWRAIKEERISGIFTDRPDVALLLRDLFTAGQRSEPVLR